MNNFLDNGAILPSGLIGLDNSALLGAFKKTYQNCALRAGIVTAYYSITDPNNVSKSVPEYDVFVLEQNEDKGSTPITYKNCTAATSFGSKADFFEAKLREVTQKTSSGTVLTPSGQNGAIVLLLCLNGLSDTGIIVSALLHPDRKTTITDDNPHLAGSYNGVNILVNADGSCSLIFNGATDNDGNITNPSQGPTKVEIDTDGSFQVAHNTITFRMDKSGEVTIKAMGRVNVQASEIDLNGTGGNVLTTETSQIIDTIFGEPTIGVPTVKAGT